MARVSGGCVYRPVVFRTRNGKRTRKRTRFYWTKYKDANGRPQRHALRPTNGQRVTDREVAESELRQIIRRVERECAGLTDRFVMAASTPMRKILADYVRHLRRLRKARKHIRQVRSYVKWVVDKGSIHRLADFNEDNIDRALGILAESDPAAKTSNEYRRTPRRRIRCLRQRRRCGRSSVTWSGRVFYSRTMRGERSTGIRCERRS